MIAPSQNINGKFDILVINGVINKMGVIWQHVREVEQYDLSGKVIVPGFFDMHVHFREPGQTYKEDITSGSLAAAYGGFTGVLCMPNTQPPIDTCEMLTQNIEKSRGNIVDVFHSACATMERKGEKLTDIKELCKRGALAITDDGNPIENDEIMHKVLEQMALQNKPVIQHCEILSISGGGVINEGVVSKEFGVKGIPNGSEYEIINRDIGLMKRIKGSHYHVQHITTKEGVDLVRKAKDEGLYVTAEVCPHHFILTDEDVRRYGTNAKINPPLRGKEDVNAVLDGLKDGTIDAICTDHAPHSKEEKDKDLQDAPFGIIGLETAFGLAYTNLVEKNILSFEQLIYKMSYNPRKILKLPEIRINEGELANFTILDLNKRWKVEVEKMHSKSKNTPFNGWELKGRPAGIANNCQHIIYE